jgi:hypothetical protein
MSGRERRPRSRQKKREEVIALPEPAVLVVLLGITGALVGEAETQIEAVFNGPVRVQSVPSLKRDDSPYRSDQIDLVLKTMATFVRRKVKAEQQPAPGGIILVYVPSTVDPQLLAAFSFYAYPIPLSRLAEFHLGRQLRHNRQEVLESIAAALAPEAEARQVFDNLHRRVVALDDAEPLQLPPTNFHVEKDRSISEAYEALMCGRRDWNGQWPELDRASFGREELPKLRKEERRKAFRDARGLIFLRAHMLAHDGRTWTVGDDAPLSAAIRQVRGAYRFGAPLAPGFHHDVQLEDDRSIKNIVFDCSERGAVQVDDVYVNIYPNDVVRGKNKAAP